MIISEKLKAAIEGYHIKLKIINDCIDKEMSRPVMERRGRYLVFLAKERAIYEFASNELKKICHEK
jgi:hypothetical protein